MPCGIPGVAAIDALMQDWSRNWKMPIGFPDGAGDGVFNDLWRAIDQYQKRKPRPQLGLKLNFERVLGEMIALASWVSPSPFGNPLREAVEDGRISGFTWPQQGEGEYFHRQLIIEQLASLLRALADHMRKASQSLDEGSAEFAYYRDVFAGLRTEFDVGIYNLNYDNLALRACPGAFTGFTEGQFDPKEVAARQEWNFVYHLHGSVHYCLPQEPPFHHVPIWQTSLDAVFDDARPLEVNMASNFIPIIPSTLVVGGYKLDQLLNDPAQTFYASLVRHAQQADCVLIAGYGFGDVHVNRTLKNRFSRSPYQPQGRPPVVTLTWTPPNETNIGQRQGYEFFSWELTHSINTRFPGNVSVPQLVEQGQLEDDYHHRAFVWHGGFLEARSILADIVARLNW
jgi:hypothetical protein